MCINKINSDKNHSKSTGYASFLGKRLDGFQSIADSGYGLYWFSQCFYPYWQGKRQIGELKLWGNMGPHYNSQRISQFSEVMVNREQHEYKSNIFILTLLGSDRSIRREIDEIKKHIYEPTQILPYELYLIKFNRLTESDKDPNMVEPDVLFKGINWVPSFKANLGDKFHLISIGCLQNSSQW